MGGSFRVHINPTIIHFAIDRSGYTKEELISGINRRFKAKYFNLNYLNNILNGSINPKYTDLKKIDAFTKRGVPFYFLNEVPVEENFINFRKLNKKYSISPNIEIKLREYYYLREEINILLEDEGTLFERLIKTYDIKSNPTSIAHEFRELFKLDKFDIEKNTSKDLFNYIRKNIEELNIFVFKDAFDMTLRGCILIDEKLPPLILVNSNDDKNAEIFTLLHEFAHYLLNFEEIDIYDPEMEYNPKIETWCNEFAYHFLMRSNDEKSEGFIEKNKDQLMDPQFLRNLSKKYKISKHAFIYRFFLLNIIDYNDYLEYIGDNPYKNKVENKKPGGNYYHTIRDRLSRNYISLVYNNYIDGNISTHEIYNYLKVKDHNRINELLEVL